MKFVLLLIYILLGLVATNACHSSITERKKRQTDQGQTNDAQLTSEALVTITLRDFFTECLESNVGPIWTWESVVDVSVLDTKWYQNTERDNCRANGITDNAECWKNRLDEYLQLDSFLQEHVRICIDEYAAVFPNFFRRKRQAFQIDKQCSNDFFPNDPAVREYGLCNQDQVSLLPVRQPIDFPSVSQFVAENTICASEFEDCNFNQMETISGNDVSVPTWPYRFEAITRTDSPVRASVFACNNLIFPLENADSSDESRCSEWGDFQACSVTCGSGRQVRSRMCPAGFSGEISETNNCQLSPCNPFQSFLDFFIINTLLNINSNSSFNKVQCNTSSSSQICK